MSAVSFASPTIGALSNRSTSLFRGVLTRFSMWRNYRRTLQELSGLSSRELDDLGLSRYTLESVAYETIYGDQR